MTMPTNSPQVRQTNEDRWRIILKSGLKGAFGGFLWSLLVAVPLVAFGEYDPRIRDHYHTLEMAYWTVGIWTVSAGLASLQRGRIATIPDEYSRIVQRAAHRAALQASFFAVPVAAFMFIGTVGYGVMSAIASVCMLLGMWLGSAALVGFNKGMKEAKKRRDAESQAGAALVQSPWFEERLERWSEGELAERRRTVEQALETRFGPLDDTARQQVRTWDQNRIVEELRKLGDTAAKEEE